ncbi:MAG: hypothetical protein M3Y67_00555 [Pseudomonadota bacterium]|nr:hypothetical protein [Pseudomonadota bacterium]
MSGTVGDGAAAQPEVAVSHESRVFFLDAEGGVRPIDHDRYVALARGEAAVHELAGRRLILVDWYVRLLGGRPEAVVNETCSWIVFDACGSLDLHSARAIDDKAAPSEAQWAQVRTFVFGRSGHAR